jgi:protoporphyrinogen oxidase
MKTIQGGLEILLENVAIHRKQNFEHSARRRYGRTVADRFLLNYTEKLWGMPCERLSPELTGGRLKGLDMRRIMSEILGVRSRQRDMEGVFLYPRFGIGMLTESIINRTRSARFLTETEVEVIYHDKRRVAGIRTGRGEEFSFEYLVNTIPLHRFLHALDPPAPSSVISASESLHYRDLLLIAVFIDQPSITRAATVYFPSRDIPFTRIAEPRNRSAAMTPMGKTSLVVEIPHDPGDTWDLMDDTRISEQIIGILSDIGWIQSFRVIDTAVERLSHAYPVISLEAKHALGLIEEYVSGFTNLRIIGRTGAYRYSWIHNHIVDAHAAVAGIMHSREWFE